MNKVLIVTYYWPPSGGAGVQRWLKFSKYLPEFGWEPFILTVEREFAAYPVTDLSLMEKLPESVKVYSTPATNYFSIYKKDASRIPTAGFANNIDNSLKGKLLRFIRGNFFLPDPRRGWNKYAFKKACGLIKSEGIRHIITTSPPHSTQLIGLKIKKRYPAIKWIADLRDPWTDIYYYKHFYPTFFSKYIDRKLEKSVLNKADRLITVGSSLKDLFALKIRGIENKIEVITNGYDEDDFSGISSTNPSVLTITYVGTLSDIYPVEGLLNSLQTLNLTGKKLILRFIGTVSQNQKELIQLHTQDYTLEIIPYVEHTEAIKFMYKSSILLLIIPDHPSNKCIITGKLFEYIASGKPIICIGPVDGDAAKILGSTGHGRTFSYSDSEGISGYLSALNSDLSINEKISPALFSRKTLTGKITQLLTDLNY